MVGTCSFDILCSLVWESKTSSSTLDIPSCFCPLPLRPMAWPRQSIEAVLEGGAPAEDALAANARGQTHTKSQFLHQLHAIFSHPQHFTFPLDLPLTWLVAFMLLRHPTPHPQKPPWVTTFYDAQHHGRLTLCRTKCAATLLLGEVMCVFNVQGDSELLFMKN